MSETSETSFYDQATIHAQRAILAVEIPPFTNGPLRYGLFAATLAATKNVPLSAAVLAGSTLGLEGGAGVAMAHVLDRGESQMVERVNGMLDRVIPEGAKVPLIGEIAIAQYLGVPALLLTKQKLDPERNLETNKRHGMLMGAWLAGACAVQGVLIGEGLTNITEPKVMAPIVGALVASGYFFKRVKDRFTKSKTEYTESMSEDIDVSTSPVFTVDAVAPRYDLSEDEQKLLEEQLVARAKEVSNEPGLVAVWVDTYSPYANLIRMRESGYFDEVVELPKEVEDASSFFMLVDTRPESEGVVHATTITGMKERGANSTGFYSIDELIRLGNFTQEEFENYYGEKGYDLSKCISIESNLRFLEHPEKFQGLKPSDWAYLSVYQRFVDNGAVLNQAGMFGTMNEDSRQSFRRVGIESEPLMGRTDLLTAEALEGEEGFEPALLPLSETNMALFGMGSRLPVFEVTTT